MSASTAPQTADPSVADTRLAPEQRRHVRFKLTLLGRFMRASKHEYPCKLNDMSVGGLAVTSPVTPDMDELIVAYFDEIGGLEGNVSRLFDGGFALRLKATRHKREKLAAQITWLINRDVLDGADRRHERTSVINKASMLVLANGTTASCRVIDVSLSGASISTAARPPIGEEVMFGKLRCRVMRYHERGIGVQFLDIQEPEALRRYFD